MVDPERVGRRLDGYSHPDVGWPGQLLGDASETLGAFGEDLVAVAGRIRHDSEHVLDERRGDLGVEEVAHGVDEHLAGPLPAVGPVQQVPVQGDAEPGAAETGVAVGLVAGVAHRFETLRQGERVAVIAAD